MNATEINQLSDRIFTSFPMIFKLLNDNSPNMTGTLAAWQKMLAKVTIDEANEVVDKWLDGRREPPKSYDADRVPLTIRSEASFNRSERQREATSEQIHSRGRTATGDPGFGNALVAMWALREKQRSGAIDEIGFETEMQSVLRMIPEPKNMREERFSCRICRDTGRARVYGHATVQQCKQPGGYDGPIDDSDIAACNCEAGDPLHEAANQKQQIARYADSKHCLVKACYRHEQLREIHTWIASNRKRDWVA